MFMGYFAYYFQVYRWPSRLLKDLSLVIYNFLWSRFVDKRKPVVVAWANCCKPQSDGELGLLDLRMFNEAHLKKLTWSFINKDSFVFKFLRDRFLKDHFHLFSGDALRLVLFYVPICIPFCLSLFGLLEITLRCSFGRIIGLVYLN